MTIKGILKNTEVVIVNDLNEWAEGFEKMDRTVGRDVIGETIVSTVFLGIDHGWGNNCPLWFETMVFGGPLDGETDRYETHAQALNGHVEMVERVKKEQGITSHKDS